MFYKNNHTDELSTELFNNPACEYRSALYWVLKVLNEVMNII